MDGFGPAGLIQPGPTVTQIGLMCAKGMSAPDACLPFMSPVDVTDSGRSSRHGAAP
jgi:hypothetical protein